MGRGPAARPKSGVERRIWKFIKGASTGEPSLAGFGGVVSMRGSQIRQVLATGSNPLVVMAADSRLRRASGVQAGTSDFTARLSAGASPSLCRMRRSSFKGNQTAQSRRRGFLWASNKSTASPPYDASQVKIPNKAEKPVLRWQCGRPQSRRFFTMPAWQEEVNPPLTMAVRPESPARSHTTTARLFGQKTRCQPGPRHGIATISVLE